MVRHIPCPGPESFPQRGNLLRRQPVAVEGFIGHYGTYSVDAANKVINLKVEGSSYPNWTGTEQKRTVISLSGDELKWSTVASVGGTAEGGWKRAN